MTPVGKLCCFLLSNAVSLPEHKPGTNFWGDEAVTMARVACCVLWEVVGAKRRGEFLGKAA